MKTQKIVLALKNSGNYIVTNCPQQQWTIVGEFEKANDLLKAVNGLSGMQRVIKSEYSQSQNYTFSNMYTAKDALRAFGLPVTKANILNIENL